MNYNINSKDFSNEVSLVLNHLEDIKILAEKDRR